MILRPQDNGELEGKFQLGDVDNLLAVKSTVRKALQVTRERSPLITCCFTVYIITFMTPLKGYFLEDIFFSSLC